MQTRIVYKLFPTTDHFRFLSRSIYSKGFLLILPSYALTILFVFVLSIYLNAFYCLAFYYCRAILTPIWKSVTVLEHMTFSNFNKRLISQMSKNEMICI